MYTHGRKRIPWLCFVLLFNTWSNLVVQADRLYLTKATSGPYQDWPLDLRGISSFDVRYVGCYANDGVSGGFEHASSMPSNEVSIQSCIEYCRSMDLTYAGLMGGVNCLCGNTYYGDIGEDCYTGHLIKCGGEANDVCGGGYGATDVYRVCPPGTYPADTPPYECSLECDCPNNGCMTDGSCAPGCMGGSKPAGDGTCYFGCDPGYWGVNCDTENTHCKGNIVHPINGYCIHGCSEAEAISIFCIIGSKPFSSDNPVNDYCPVCANCIDKFCYDVLAGDRNLYYGCPAQWSGTPCVACEAGWWSEHCTAACVPHCVHCGKEDGVCAECMSGWWGQQCDQACPANCMNDKCVRSTGDCEEGCVGEFVGVQCGACAAGKYGELCDQVCAVNCASVTCDRNTSACDNGCKEGTWGLTCNEACGRCVSGSCARGDGACEACEVGTYGAGCNDECDELCKNRVCQSNGDCYECKDGYRGDQCQAKCPEYCLNDICDRDTGACTQGCIYTYSGEFCDTKNTASTTKATTTTAIASGETPKEDKPVASSDKKLPPLETAGIIVGSVLVGSILMSASLIFFVLKKLKKDKKVDAE